MRDRVQGRFFPLNDLEIEQYLCGELPEAQRQRVEASTAASADLTAHLEQRRAEQQAFFAAHPRLPLEALRPSPAVPRRWPAWSFALAGAAAAVAIVVFGLWGRPQDPVVDPVADPAGGSVIRARGSLKAGLTVRRGERTFPHRQGVLLRPGDQVRLSIESAQGGYLTLIGRDRSGRLAVYYDSLPTTSGTWTGPGSLVLDEDLHPERWYVILSPERVGADLLVERLRRGETLAGAATVIRIEKENAE